MKQKTILPGCYLATDTLKGRLWSFFMLVLCAEVLGTDWEVVFPVSIHCGDVVLFKTTTNNNNNNRSDCRHFNKEINQDQNDDHHFNKQINQDQSSNYLETYSIKWILNRPKFNMWILFFPSPNRINHHKLALSYWNARKSKVDHFFFPNLMKRS